MGIENMRRWPMYIVFAICIMLTLSLFNSWSLETELRNKVAEVSSQLMDCTRVQKSFMEESVGLLEDKEKQENKIRSLDEQKNKLEGDLKSYKEKLSKTETQVNRTQMDVQLCTTELQSLKNLQVSKSATLETLRLETETLTAQLNERKQKVEELEKEVERLRSALTTKSAPNPSPPSKVTPAAAPPKISQSLNNLQNPLINNEQVDNDAKEEFEDTNALNDGNDFDPQLQ